MPMSRSTFADVTALRVSQSRWTKSLFRRPCFRRRKHLAYLSVQCGYIEQSGLALCIRSDNYYVDVQ
jgi:hypothetical protein